MRPFVQDVEALAAVTAGGDLITCSRDENAALFRHVIGGYGLVGAVYSVHLRLTRRRILRRRVRLVRADGLMGVFTERIAAGALYGDWQFAIDSASEDFLDLGVCSTYECDERQQVPSGQRQLGEEDWCRLLLLAHREKTQGFEEYSRYYLSTDGQLYWSDAHQFGTYVENYHARIDAATGSCPGSEMISELYVPRERLPDFLRSARRHLRRSGANVIYGTVRLIERDDETALAWARESWACVVFNLHVDHTEESVARARLAFRGLIDCALECQGSYYLTYHRWATCEQALAAHPKLPQFLEYKRRCDPDGLFQSDWSRHLHQ
jgi:FAD/FMN-containing dehydrogenase